TLFSLFPLNSAYFHTLPPVNPAPIDAEAEFPPKFHQKSSAIPQIPHFPPLSTLGKPAFVFLRSPLFRTFASFAVVRGYPFQPHFSLSPSPARLTFPV